MSVDYRPDYDPADVDSDYGHTGGDITVPTFTGDTRPFRFWCQKALPLVYDDSLSYYEVLCKMADYMNNFMTDLTTVEDSMTEFGQQFVINQQFLNDMADQLGENVADLEAYINDRMDDFMTAYTQLQTYVNNYFDNLDVQEEINTKLDEMASDGTLNDLFDPVLETWMQQKTAQIDAAIANQDAIQAAQNGRISVLEGRMDTFSGLPSGSTSGNAELLDIRTNFLGETYPTAGDAVRASDMIASGFQSIGFSRLTEWNGNESESRFDTIQIDVRAYKGGHMVVIFNAYQFETSIETAAGIELFGSNVAGKNIDSNAQQYPFPDGTSGLPSPVFKDFTVLTTSVLNEERIVLQLAIPEDFQYQYLKLGNVAPIPGEGYSYTQPAAIVYANSWSKTQVDPTLEIAGAAADAKATGDAIDELNERLDSEIADLIAFLFDESILTNTDSYIDNYGRLRNASGFSASDFIKIVPSSSFCILAPTTGTGAGANAISFYSTNAQTGYLTGQSITSGTDDIVVTAPKTANYIRFCYSDSGVFRCAFMANKSLPDIYGNIAEVIYYNQNIDIKNSSLTTNGKYITTNGTLADHASFNVSDFYLISDTVKDITVFQSGTISGGYNIAFYADDDFTAYSFISGVAFSNPISTETHITIPERAKYVVFCSRNTSVLNVKITYINIKEKADYLPYKGKKISLLGDSITSYQGYIPSGNNYYYPHSPNLTDVNNTWWKQLIDNTGMVLLVNNSFSGAKLSGSASSSGLSRSENLDDGSNTPDIIIVYMGVNDFETDTPVGTCGLDQSTYSVDNFSDAYYTALSNIKTKYPNAKLFLCTIMQYGTAFPVNNGVNYLIDYNDAIYKLASLFGAEVIDFAKCGISVFSRVLNTIDNLHPNIPGHYLMYKEAIKHFKV